MRHSHPRQLASRQLQHYAHAKIEGKVKTGIRERYQKRKRNKNTTKIWVSIREKYKIDTGNKAKTRNAKHKSAAPAARPVQYFFFHRVRDCCLLLLVVFEAFALRTCLPRSGRRAIFFRRTCGRVGGPREKSSSGKGRNNHTMTGSLARESMTYPETCVSSVGCSASSLVTKSTKAASTDCP